MPVIYASKAKTYEMPGVSFVGLAAPQTGSKENSAWQFSLDPNTHGTAHHLTREEIIIVTSGSAVAEIGTDKHEISTGDAIIIPAFTHFKLSNSSSAPVICVAVLPIGARAIIDSEPPFTPPWTQ